MKALTLGGAFVPDLSVATEPGTTYRVEWVTVPDRDAATRLDAQAVHRRQITRSRKLEGMWWGDGGAYFVASFARTSDGSAAQHDGQVWFLDPLDGHDRAQAAVRLHAGRPGRRPRRPGQHHGLAVRRRDPRRGRRRQAAPRRRDRRAARRSSSPATSTPDDSRVHRARPSRTTRRRCSPTSRPRARVRDPGAVPQAALTTPFRPPDPMGSGGWTTWTASSRCCPTRRSWPCRRARWSPPTRRRSSCSARPISRDGR